MHRIVFVDDRLTGPPADPQDWTDEEWLAWLRATDEGCAAPESREPPLETRSPVDLDVDGDEGSRAASSSDFPVVRRGGGVLGSAMLGLAQAMYGAPDPEIAVVQEAPGDRNDDDPYELHLDRDHPERSTVIIRRNQKRTPT